MNFVALFVGPKMCQENKGCSRHSKLEMSNVLRLLRAERIARNMLENTGAERTCPRVNCGTDLVSETYREATLFSKS